MYSKFGQFIDGKWQPSQNNAKSQLKSKTAEEISKASGNFGIPGFKWPL